MAGVQSHPIVSWQPIRLLFQLIYASTIVARLPFWILTALIKPLRPNPRWTVKQALIFKLAYAGTDLNSRIGITEKLSLKPGKEGSRFQIIQPSTSDVYKGPIAAGPGAKPVPVGATWYPKPLDKGTDAKLVFLCFHGGAFVLGDGRDKFYGFAVRTLAEKTGADFVLSVSYRLAGYAGRDPFPAAVQDAVTAYLHLVRTLGVPPQNIVISGDSAGGNLTLALVRYIHEFGPELDIPAPKAAAIFSPWVAPFDNRIEASPRYSSDYLPSSFLRWGAQAYTAGLPDATTNPYINPLGNPFASPVPIFANAGTVEVFYDGIQRWAEEMTKVNGNRIELHHEEAGLHDTILVGDKLGFEENAQATASALAAFLRKL